MGYVRIRQGIYLPSSYLPQEAPRWKTRRVITEARALSVSLKAQGTPPPVLTMESALILQDVTTWTNTADITYRVHSNRGKRCSRRLAGINVEGVGVCAVAERQLMSKVPRTDTVKVKGVLSAPLDIAALDCARFLHPLPGLVAVSGVLTRFSTFNRWNQPESRAAAEYMRNQILSDLEAVSGRQGTVQAAELVKIADPGLQTPGESYLWWLLHCILPDDLIKDLVTQFPIDLGWNTYFPDAALPQRKICFEFDGYGKIHENEREFLRRQRALQQAGWIPIRIDQGQLDNPDALVAFLLDELRRNAILAHHPRGRLWRPLTRELLSPTRRF